MSKYLFFPITFLLSAILVSAVPMPWGIAINEETNECAGYWGGDEFKGYPLPDGWIVIYPWSDNWSKISNVEECDLQGKDTSLNSKICCEKLGYKYISENIGWEKDYENITYDNQENQNIEFDEQDVIEKNNNTVIILVGGITILIIVLVLFWILKTKK